MGNDTKFAIGVILGLIGVVAWTKYKSLQPMIDETPYDPFSAASVAGVRG